MSDLRLLLYHPLHWPRTKGSSSSQPQAAFQPAVWGPSSGPWARLAETRGLPGAPGLPVALKPRYSPPPKLHPNFQGPAGTPLCPLFTSGVKQAARPNPTPPSPRSHPSLSASAFPAPVSLAQAHPTHQPQPVKPRCFLLSAQQPGSRLPFTRHPVLPSLSQGPLEGFLPPRELPTERHRVAPLLCLRLARAPLLAGQFWASKPHAGTGSLPAL